MIGRRFFQRDPITCARELIGCELVWHNCSGIIVETEAYAARDDEASHIFSRPSTRRFVAEHPAGTAYVYFNYGMYWLVNVLVKGGAEDGFVLFRGLEPRAGLGLMQARRGVTEPRKLCSGPGKICQAMAITGADHGRDFCGRTKEIGFRPRDPSTPVTVEEDLRVGISRSAHLPWRFLLGGSRHVSVAHGKVKPHLPKARKR